MVFSSINPIYLDPPNWQQEQNQLQSAEDGATNDCSSQLLLPPRQTSRAGGCSGAETSNFRPSGSMTERARQARIPLPEPGLKCPRCDSTNTKFCYFNNYNLSQPRHFCKTCRRYWTRGGALRNVPVGGGCRRNNKRNKEETHKRSKSSPLVSHEAHVAEPSLFSGGCADVLSQIPALPLLPPLNHLGHEYNSGENELRFGGSQFPSSTMSGFQVGSSSSGILEQFRSLQQLQPFPFLTTFGAVPPPSAVYSFDGEGVQPASYGVPVRFKVVEGGLAPAATVKAEESIHQGGNLSKNFTEISTSAAAGNEQIWSGNSNAWTDLSGFINSSTSINHL